MQGRFEQLVLVVAEDEQSVPDDRTSTPDPSVPERERARVDGEPGSLRSDPAVISHPLIHRSRQLVGSTAGDRVHGSADEVAFTNVVWRDTHLHLLNRLQRDWCDQRSTACLTLSQPERAVEVGAVHRHVVYPAILARE